MKKLKELKAGEFFKLSASSTKVYAMGVLINWRYTKCFDRKTKSYEVTNFSDSSITKQVKADREVFVEFEF